jgi:ABC-2 type transport system permease protein
MTAAALRAFWGVARHELVRWLHSPGAIAAALFPALGMGGLVAVLTISIGWQPLALVVESEGETAKEMAALIEGDEEAYRIERMSREEADLALRQMRVAAAVIIPADFDDRIGAGRGEVDLYLNNVTDVDLGDDIRRALTRSLAEFDAPILGVVGERNGPTPGVLIDNPFRVAVAEHNLRDTNVSFFHYQMIPIVVLIVLSVGLLGTAMLTARDFESHTAKLLALSPVSRVWLVTGRLFGGVLLTLAVVAPLLALAAAMKWIEPPPGHWGPFLALIGSLVVMAVGLGLLLGLLVRNTRLVAMTGLNAAACLFFLGGGFCTVPFLPEWIQDVSRLVPTSYAISGLRQALFYPDLVGFARDLTAVSATAAGAAVAGGLALGRAWRRA